jgi:hypothetical protein
MKVRTPRPLRATRAEPILDVWCGLASTRRTFDKRHEVCRAHLGTVWRVENYEWSDRFAEKSAGGVVEQTIALAIGMAFMAAQRASSIGQLRIDQPYVEWPLQSERGSVYPGCPRHDMIEIPREWLFDQTDGFETWPTRIASRNFPSSMH